MYITAVDTENKTSRINTAQAHIATPDGRLVAVSSWCTLVRTTLYVYLIYLIIISHRLGESLPSGLSTLNH